MKSSVVRWLSIPVLVSALWAGCAGLGKPLQAPEVRMAGLRIEKVDFFETVLDLQLRVFNTNDMALELKGLECRLEINGEPLARGLASQPVRLPALSTATVSVTVFSSALDIANSFYRIVQPDGRPSDNGELTYRLKGKLHLSGDALLPPTLPFDTTGVLPVRKLLQSRGAEIRLDH
ncbi:MAG TPA: LEA type 2 family protein [Desulfobacterales bacterium]